MDRKNRQDGKRQTEGRLLDRKKRQEGKRQTESRLVGQEELAGGEETNRGQVGWTVWTLDKKNR